MLRRRYARALMFFLPSYLIVILITLGSFGWVLYNSMRADMIDSVIGGRRYALKQYRSTVDDLCAAFANTAARVSQDTALTPYTLKSSGADKLAALSRLSAHNANPDMIREIFLYIDGVDTIASSKGEYRLRMLFDTMLTYEGGWTGDDLLSVLRDCSHLCAAPANARVVRAYSKERYVALFAPLRSAGVRYATLMALVPEKYLTERLDGVEGAVWALDAQGTLAFANAAAGNMQEADFTRLFPALALDSSLTEKLRGGDRTYLCETSDYLGWRFVAAVEHREFGEALWGMKKQIFILLGALLVAGLMLGACFSLYYYRPIRKLGDALSVERGESGGLFQSEMGEIYRSVVRTVNDNYDLKRLVNEGSHALRRQALSDLLSGNADEKTLSDCGVRLPGPEYCVLMLRTADTEPPSAREEIVSILGMLEGISAYGLDMFSGIVAVIFSSRDNAQAKLYAGRILNAVEEESGRELLAGLGDNCRDAGELNRSAMEAMTALEALRLRGGERIVCYSSLREEAGESGVWQSSPSRALLAQAMRFGDKKVFYQTLDTLKLEFARLKSLPGGGMPLSFARADLLSQVARAASDTGWRESGAYIERLVRAQSTEEMFAGLEEMSRAFSEWNAAPRDDRGQQLTQQICAYIDERFMLPQLSLGEVAERFNISESWLSRTFKAKMGVTFLKYVTDLRMETVCRLLRESDRTIRDIMLSVGYLDLASFTRRFTGIYSVSPGQYRAAHRRE